MGETSPAVFGLVSDGCWGVVVVVMALGATLRTDGLFLVLRGWMGRGLSGGAGILPWEVVW